MERVPLAVDIDETIVYLLRFFLEYYNNKNGTAFSEEGFCSYRWWEILRISKEQAYAEAVEWAAWKTRDEGRPVNGYFGIQFVEGAEQGLDLLSRYYQLHAISDRSPVLDPDTFNISCALYVEEGEGTYFPDIPVGDTGDLILPTSQIYLTKEWGMPKAEICHMVGAKTIIEDNGDRAIECAEEGVEVLLLEKPWNKGVERENITRVSGWQEVCDLLTPSSIRFPYPYEARYL